jgi:hypothetical protein
MGNLAGNNIERPLVIIVTAHGKSHDMVSRGNPGNVSDGGPIIHPINKNAGTKW